MSSDITVGLTPDQYGQVHPEETPEMIKTKLAAFNDEVDKLPEEAKKDLLTAQQKCPQLLTDDFKLMFLRCEVFNADLAAKRYAHYWEQRVEICGPDKAFLPLSLQGDGSGSALYLPEDDVALGIGFFNYVPAATDPIGRGIVFVQPGKQDRSKYTRPSMARAIWYVLHALLHERVEVQQHGVIFLAHPHGAKFGQFDRGLMKLVLGSIQGALPVRLSAFHICQPPPFIKIILPIAKLFMSDRTKKRLNIHFGSKADVLKKLETYGLTKDRLPAPLGGELAVDMPAWLAERRAAGK